MNLWPHQSRIIEANPERAILAWEMRAGKSAAGAAWLINQPGTVKIIICPKQLKKDWEAFGTKAQILSKEEFKKIAPYLENVSAILIDEAHYFAAPLFIKGRSQLATALYGLIKRNPDMHVMLLTATPIRNNAWSLHTLLCYIGVYYDWKQWREEFFSLEWPPYLTHPIWMPKADWRIKIRKYLEKHCDIISLKDIVEYLPPATEKIIKIKQKPYKRPIDKLVTWTDEHRWEQQGKAEEIMKLGYRKLVVIVHFTAQIDELEAILSKEKPVFVLDGRTKDAPMVKLQAQEASDCYFIVQSSMAFGWDGYMFGAMVFASMSHSCVNHTQALGRSRHLKHLQPLTYYYLIGGKWDERIYQTVAVQGKEFNPHIYLANDNRV